uniref:Putative ixostatin n=1 Tax=Ixodes ricinus TaxID=34613 RepID=A0A0K8RI32_IXORI
MISTRFLLLFAALALACTAVGSAKKVKGRWRQGNRCPTVSEQSFRRLNQSRPKPPRHFSVGLGEVCKHSFFKNAKNVICLGHPGTASRDCRLCCACSNGATITYSNKTAPIGYPCGKKDRGECNAFGSCVPKKHNIFIQIMNDSPKSNPNITN